MKPNGWAILLALCGGLSTVLGLGLAWRQAHWRHTFTKTAATVTESSMVHSRLGGYRAAITYTYKVQGQRHTASRFAPLPVFGSVAWARRLERTYPLKQSISAYVDPDQPSRAFLHRTSLFYPYALMLVGLSMLGPAATWSRRGAVMQSPPAEAPSTSSDHWLGLKPRAIALNEAVMGSALAATYLILSGAVVAHYWIALGPDYDRLAWFCPAFFFAGLVWLRAANRRMIAASALGPVTLETALAQPTLDAPILARTSLQLTRNVHLKEAKLFLVCLRRQNGRSARLYCSGQTIAANQPCTSGQRLTLETSFEVPPNKHRTTRRDANAEIRWQFEVHFHRPPAASVITVFPITLRSPNKSNPSNAPDHEHPPDHGPIQRSASTLAPAA